MVWLGRLRVANAEAIAPASNGSRASVRPRGTVVGVTVRTVLPEGRGFLLFDAHPTGCARVVDELAAEAADTGAAAPAIDRPVALIIGVSAGYGLAAAVTGLVRHGMRGVGICHERPASDRRTATAGWYRAERLADLARTVGGDLALVNADCFSDETKAHVVQLLRERYGRVDYLIYSVAAPRRRDPQTGTVHQSVVKPLGSAFNAPSLTQGSDGRPVLTWHSVEPATAEQCAATVAVMGGADWAAWVRSLASADLLGPRFRTAALSYVGPELISAIYRRGTIGAAKEHLERTARELTDGLLRDTGGLAVTSVHGSAVTQASTAIPGFALYAALLRRALGSEMRTPVQQLVRLWEELAGAAAPVVDAAGRVRLDGWELHADVQAQVRRAWEAADERTLAHHADTPWLFAEARRIYGFDVAGVDYAAPVETNPACSFFIQAMTR